MISLFLFEKGYSFFWWFKKVQPTSASFQAFFVPAKIGTYTIAYPANPARIVLASNAGSGDLSGAEIAGSLYIENIRDNIGFNPNEEHALMLAGRIYALRDDLNIITSDAGAYTSEPFALLSYTHPTDNRPAMRAFKILRELDVDGTVDDKLFSYPVTAGTIIQGPMPLPLLPLPVVTLVDTSGAYPGVSAEERGQAEAIARAAGDGLATLQGARAVVVGASNIVGKPLAALLMQKAPHCNATVTLVHSFSEKLEEICRQADILIAAIGKPAFIKKNMIFVS